MTHLVLSSRSARVSRAPGLGIAGLAFYLLTAERLTVLRCWELAVPGLSVAAQQDIFSVSVLVTGEVVRW